MIFMLPGDRERIRLRVFNSQGGERSNLFDPLFCAGKYLFNSGFSGNEDINIEYGNGTSSINVIDSTHFRIKLGLPYSYPEGSPLKEEPEREYSRAVILEGRKQFPTPVILEFPMAVFFPSGEPAGTLKKMVEAFNSLKDPLLKELQPVFATTYSREEMLVRVWFGKRERDYTAVCAGALVASVVQGFTDREVLAHCQGSSFFLQWLQPSNLLYCTGEAEYVYYGSSYYDPKEE